MKNHHLLGIDLGGTNTKLGVATPDGELLKTVSIPTQPEFGAEAWVKRVAQEIQSWNMSFSKIGVGSPGPLDTQTGTILAAPNLKSFEGYSMKKGLENELQCPALFENDANCGALAEYRFGEFKGEGHLISITLGTGVGSGVISHHHLVRGAGGFAVEIGHLIIDHNEWGKGTLPEIPEMQGTFEGFVGAKAALYNFRDWYSKNNIDLHLGLRPIFQAAEAGDKLAQSHVQFWIRSLAVGLYNCFLIFNPRVIILAGGVSASWGYIRPHLDLFLNAWVPAPLLKSSQKEPSWESFSAFWAQLRSF